MSRQPKLFSEQCPKRTRKELGNVDYREYRDLVVYFNLHLAALINYVERRGLGTNEVDKEKYLEAFSTLDVSRYAFHVLFPDDIEAKYRTTDTPIVKHISELCMDISNAYLAIQALECSIAEKDRRKLRKNPLYADYKASLVEDMKLFTQRLIQEGVPINEIQRVGAPLLKVMSESKPIWL